MANKNKRVIVDSDAIFAIYNPNDPLNTKSINTFRKLNTDGYELIYPTSVIFEVVSLFQRVLPTPKVIVRLIEMISNDELEIYAINNELLREAAAIFNPAGSRKNTLIDCSVAAMAKKLKAKAVFSYDKFYKKQGLKPAEDLLNI